jgi:CRISPR-associated protein Csd2
MNIPQELHHKVIQLPADRKIGDVVGERHEFVLLFDCAKSNPNGDPDTGNMPRVQPDSLNGLVTDVCLKRKIRNVFALYNPDGSLVKPYTDSWAGYDLFIREGAVIERLVSDPNIEQRAKEIFIEYKADGLTFDEKAWKAASGGKPKPTRNKEGITSEAEAAEPEGANGTKSKEQKPSGNRYAEYRDRAFRDAICATYFDVRYFGQVVSTEGPLKGSFYGQIRGPLQFTFSESLDKVLPLDATITRCAVASEKEALKKDDDNRTMGRKFGIDYGLYRCHIHFSPAFAAKTGFTYYDLDNFLFALTHMFDDDHAAGRHLRLIGLVDFQHQSALGNAPAHKLFELVKVQGVTEERDGKEVFKSSGREFPRSLGDYCGEAPNGEIYKQPDGSFRPNKPEKKDGNEPVASIVAHRIIWEVFEKSAAATAAAS